MIEIPQKVIHSQPNLGDKFGDLWASWNLDLLSSPGNVRVSPRTLINTRSTVVSTAVHPIAFVRNLAGSSSADTFFAVCSQNILSTTVSGDNPASSFSTDFIGTVSGLSNKYSDAVSWQNWLMVSQLTTVGKLNSGTWTADWMATLSGSPSLTTGIAHPLCAGFTNELLIGNGNKIVSVDTSNTVDTARLTLQSDYEVTWIRSSNSLYWIGARHKGGGVGKIYAWDGASETPTGDYSIGSALTFSCVIKDEIPYALNNRGILLAFNGAGFTEVARLPIANSKNDTFNDNFNAGSYAINVHRNGMALIDGRINILLSAGINGTRYTLLENMNSGIWEYTKETGIYHKYSLSKAVGSNPIDSGSPMLAQAGALMPLAGSDKFLAGVQLATGDGSTDATEIGIINTAGTFAKDKMGYLITPKLFGKQVEETWQNIYLTYKVLQTTGDFIKIKYRTSVNYRTTFSQPATWASTTTFTTTATEFSGVSPGDEIEIISGEGSGYSATITDISLNAGTYTVTIDYTVANASGTFAFKISNWTLLDSVTDLVTAYKQVALSTTPSNWIQFKIILYGTGGTDDFTSDSPELQKILVQSEPNISLN